MDAKLTVALANLQLAIEGKQEGVIRVLEKPPTLDALREYFGGEVPAEVEAALQHAKPRYVERRALCEVLAGDILTVACKLPKRCPVCLALIKGCAVGKPERLVAVQADDVRTLLKHAEKADLVAPEPVSPPPAAHAAVDYGDQIPGH